MRRSHPSVSGRADILQPLECCAWKVILVIFCWQNLLVDLSYVYNSFSWRNKNKFNLPHQENFTELSSSKPGCRGEWYFPGLRRWLFTENLWWLKILGLSILKLSPSSQATLSKPPAVARAYFISIFLGRHWKSSLTWEGWKAGSKETKFINVLFSLAARLALASVTQCFIVFSYPLGIRGNQQRQVTSEPTETWLVPRWNSRRRKIRFNKWPWIM